MFSIDDIASHAWQCPHDQQILTLNGWIMPGMRSLARLHCSHCSRTYFSDLPTGHGLSYPMLLEADTGIVHDRFDIPWFANWLRDSYRDRSSDPISLQVDSRRPIKTPLIANCLDPVYGHALLKLLAIQHYLDKHHDTDIVLIVPKWLHWLVPEGVSEVWTVDLSLRQCGKWSTWLEQHVEKRFESFERCFHAILPPIPRPVEYDIERFTGVRPFSLDQWHARAKTPVVTFLIRDDRHWVGNQPKSLFRFFRNKRRRRSLENQRLQVETVTELASQLKGSFPTIDFAVTGVCEDAGFPSEIQNLCSTKPTSEVERIWCQRYASSHVVIGVQGSNMLLPSAHAGATICLVDRWGNLGQDILLGKKDALDVMLTQRFLPLTTDASVLADVVTHLLKGMPTMQLNFQSPWTDPLHLAKDSSIVWKQRLQMADDRT